MIVGIAKESISGERRVAVVPDVVKALIKKGHEVRFQAGAGVESGHPDDQYVEAGATAVGSFEELASSSDILAKIQAPTDAEQGSLSARNTVFSLLRPLDEAERISALAARGVNAFSLELMPRITRAQSMDVLSSQSTIAGYRAVLLAASALPRILPMMVTAAGTLQPAKVLVIGAGVAGLQALGTAKRLGAVTLSYDTRAAVKEQVESLGAKFVELDLDTGDSEDSGGYAKAQTEEFYERQRSELAKHIAGCDIVITTALVPGQPAPRLVTEDAVRAMRPGSVVVDLAAEKGGNCDCTVAAEDTMAHGVTIIGRTNLPAEIPAHASQMFAKNLLTFLDHLFDDEGSLQIDLEDEITAGTLVARDGKVVHPMLLERLGSQH
ncbi:MAG: Re/Si-specific NAD(P)(+) transhydrogenase subunit alpha [Myxococcota bacterium]|nr:Re/Si-specific NAD(P)(+) transhydrogenase subunit alpha [Myxococcota bacterium]